LVAFKAKEENKIEMILELNKEGSSVPQIAKVSKKASKRLKKPLIIK
jgi:hypothetical protein